MMDFTTAAAIEIGRTVELERKAQRDGRKWHRALRELRREGAFGIDASPRRRKELRREFVSALDAAHAAGMTVDAYMTRGVRVLTEQSPPVDAELNERADWAGLNDGA